MTKSNRLKEKTLYPYRPSWIDHITISVGQTRIHYVLVYFIAWVIFLSVLIALRWQDQTFPTGHIEISDVVMSATGIFFVALVHYLDQWARKKLGVFREAIQVNDDEFERLRYQLSTLPPHSALVASIISFSFGALTYIISPSSYGFLNISFQSPSSGMQLVNFLFS